MCIISYAKKGQMKIHEKNMCIHIKDKEPLPQTYQECLKRKESCLTVKNSNNTEKQFTQKLKIIFNHVKYVYTNT